MSNMDANTIRAANRNTKNKPPRKEKISAAQDQSEHLRKRVKGSTYILERCLAYLQQGSTTGSKIIKTVTRTNIHEIQNADKNEQPRNAES